MDLVVVSRNSQPPVARIIDWGKYSYQRDKKQQLNRRTTKTNETKQMRFGLKIGDHDINVKLRKVTEFLNKDYKVKLAVFLRGREMEHKELGFDLAESLVDRLNGEDYIAGDLIIDQPPRLNGRLINLVVRKDRNKNAQNQEPSRHQGPDSRHQNRPGSGPQVTSKPQPAEEDSRS